jgi:hypothetical protein
VAPGDRRVLALTAHNDSSAAGRYHIEVGGLPPEWYDLDRPRVALGPGNSEHVALTVHPPAGRTPAPRSYSMTVRMRAEDDLSIQAATIATVVVSAPDALDMDVQPTEVAGEEAIFCVTFLNQSAVPASIQLLVHDDQNGLRVHVTPETSVLVPAGATAAPLIVDVAPRRRKRHGAPQTYAIEFRGRLLGDEALLHPDLVLQARFTYLPPGAASRLGRWLTRAIALLSLVPLLLTSGCLPGSAEAPWQSARRSGVPRSPE